MEISFIPRISPYAPMFAGFVLALWLMFLKMMSGRYTRKRKGK